MRDHLDSLIIKAESRARGQYLATASVVRWQQGSNADIKVGERVVLFTDYVTASMYSVFT
jgi:hypothetical protein